jgi:DNA-binding NtrC family response regulator/tetratricopeptide (TPR) repeat protein
MKTFLPERFDVIRVMKENRYLKTVLANDRVLNRQNVVVKIMSRDHVNDSRERSIAHFSWWTGLTHSQFCPVWDAGMTKQRHLYQVRQYVPHSELLMADPIVVTKALVSAIDFLSRHNRIHGALKPSNIFINGNVLQIADARLLNTASLDEESIHFTAPEILRGGTPILESDLYSLGSVLYRLLMGRHLFEDLDVSRLKAKYLAGTVQPISCAWPVSQSMAGMILELLSRDPETRVKAFEQLRTAISCRPVDANRAPYIGREQLLADTAQALASPVRTLQVHLVEGPIGIGKSRFVAELRLRCALRGVAFAVWKRTACGNSAIKYLPTLLHEALDSLKPRRKRSSNESYAAIPEAISSPTELGAGTGYPIEKEISDVISLIGSLAKTSPLVLAFDDVDLADDETLLLMHHMVFRASDLPLSLVLTATSTEVDMKLSEMIRCCLNSDFFRVFVPLLSYEESQKLLQILHRNRQRQNDVFSLTGGHPVFIEGSADPFNDERMSVRQLATAMMNKLTKATRSFLQTLSVFREPISVDVLVELCGTNATDVNDKIKITSRLGLVRQIGGTAEISSQIIRAKLYSSLPKGDRVRLNAAIFRTLKESESDKEMLACYAFEAKLYSEAAELYGRLAAETHQVQKYQTALRHYSRLEECCERTGNLLSPKQLLNLAQCCDKTGKQRVSARIYEELISESRVTDPELASTVYTRMATRSVETSIEERVRYLDKALECIANDSRYVRRYTVISETFLRMGQLDRAREGLKTAEDLVIRDKRDASLLNNCQALFSMSTGDFRRALKYFSMPRPDYLDQAALHVCMGFCFECLGDLTKALECQVDARRLALDAGNKLVEVLSLHNIAAIKTKCGDLAESESLFDQVRATIKEIRAGNMIDKESFLAVAEADAAIHAMYTGNYARAHHCIRNFQKCSKPFINFDRVLADIPQLKFLIEIGWAEKVPALLRALTAHSISELGYLQVERVLIESQLPQIPADDRLGVLQRGLTLSKKLGTRYQLCELLLSAAALYLEVDQRRLAEIHARKALTVATKFGYGVLEARCLLVVGRASTQAQGRERFLIEAFQLASQLGLQEVLAEAAYHIGILNLDSNNTLTAREYLVRSTSITARLAEGVPAAARPKYLAKAWRRDALRALDRCNEAIPLHSSWLFSTESDKYFAETYRFTMAAAGANSIEILLKCIEHVIEGALKRSAVVTLKNGADSHLIPVRTKLSPELTQRIDTIRSHARNRVHFESLDDRGRQVCAWVPLNSETSQGGIYVASRSHEPHFSEKEMELLTMVGTIATNALRRLEARQAHESEPRELTDFHGIIGASKAINEVYSQIRMAAGNAATVLIEGESGTGKELVAKAIHTAGPRAKGPFVAVDCGAIPESLIEAELFGAKKGSYTGAVTDRAGLFEAANRGAIFLDEISNTTATLQAKLLRVIQEREIRRIGETKDRPIDVRLIVASNQSLDTLAAAGRFRKDLLYRLKVLHIKVPPLRDRRDDIPMLAHAFLQRLNASNKTKKYFAAGVIDHLATQTFPGNVRELQNAIERAFVLAKGVLITDVPLEVHRSAPANPADEVETWFKDISEGRQDFWSAIRNRYKHRDISREKVVALVDFGLRSTKGSYKTMASLFRLQEKEYHRFMDFLRRNDCLLDFRPYRKAAE